MESYNSSRILRVAPTNTSGVTLGAHLSASTEWLTRTTIAPMQDGNQFEADDERRFNENTELE